MNSVYEAHKAELAARKALNEASAARVAAQKAEANRKWRARPENQWFERQCAIAAHGSRHVEQVVVRADHSDKIGQPILWDIVCLCEPERTRRREPSRRKADDYARSLRVRGKAVRVVQNGF